MTMTETIIIVALLVVFLLLEMYKTDPRALLHKPTDESPFFVDLFKPVKVVESDDDSRGPWKSSADAKKKP